MEVYLQGLTVTSKVKGQAAKVQRSVNSVDGRMVVGTDKGDVFQSVLTAATEPMDVVTMTKWLPVLLPRMPKAYLTAAIVQDLELINQARVACGGLLIQVFSPLLCDTRGLVGNQTFDRLRSPQQKGCLQAFFW
jgi:hypothetical protein